MDALKLNLVRGDDAGVVATGLALWSVPAAADAAATYKANVPCVMARTAKAILLRAKRWARMISPHRKLKTFRR